MYLKPRQTNGIPFHPPTTPTTHRIQIRQRKNIIIIKVLFVHSFFLKFYDFFFMFHFY